MRDGMLGVARSIHPVGSIKSDPAKWNRVRIAPSGSAHAYMSRIGRNLARRQQHPGEEATWRGLSATAPRLPNALSNIAARHVERTERSRSGRAAVTLGPTKRRNPLPDRWSALDTLDELRDWYSARRLSLLAKLTARGGQIRWNFVATARVLAALKLSLRGSRPRRGGGAFQPPDETTYDDARRNYCATRINASVRRTARTVRPAPGRDGPPPHNARKAYRAPA